MIAILGLAGLICFMLVSIAVGLRLLLLARQTRQLPETLVGASLFLSGGMGLALSIAASAIPNLAGGTLDLIVRSSILFNAAGYFALYLFVWLVFRRDALWGRVLFGVCSLALLVGTFGDLLTRQSGGQVIGPEAAVGPFVVLSLLSRLVAYGWAAWESFAYYGMMTRRLALGLAEETLVKRFKYWGICMSASFLIFVTILVDKELVEAGTVSEVPTVISALLGFVLSGALHQAFFSKRGNESAPPETDPMVNARGAS